MMFETVIIEQRRGKGLEAVYNEQRHQSHPKTDIIRNVGKKAFSTTERTTKETGESGQKLNHSEKTLNNTSKLLNNYEFQRQGEVKEMWDEDKGRII